MGTAQTASGPASLPPMQDTKRGTFSPHSRSDTSPVRTLTRLLEVEVSTVTDSHVDGPENKWNPV